MSSLIALLSSLISSLFSRSFLLLSSLSNLSNSKYFSSRACLRSTTLCARSKRSYFFYARPSLNLRRLSCSFRFFAFDSFCLLTLFTMQVETSSRAQLYTRRAFFRDVSSSTISPVTSVSQAIRYLPTASWKIVAPAAQSCCSRAL